MFQDFTAGNKAAPTQWNVTVCADRMPLIILKYSLRIVAVGPEQQVHAVIWIWSRGSQSAQPSGEAAVVQSGIKVQDVHVRRITVLHRPCHCQQVLLHALPQRAHLHRCISHQTPAKVSPRTSGVHTPDTHGLTSLFRCDESLLGPPSSSSVASKSRASTMLRSRVLWVLRHLWGRHIGTRFPGHSFQRWSCSSCCWMETIALLRMSRLLKEDEEKVLWIAIHICSLRVSKSLSSWSSSSSLQKSWVKSCSSLIISFLLTSSSWSCCWGTSLWSTSFSVRRTISECHLIFCPFCSDWLWLALLLVLTCLFYVVSSKVLPHFQFLLNRFYTQQRWKN